MTTRSYRWLFWCLAVTGLVLDQASKYGVFAWLDDGSSSNPRTIIPGAFLLDPHYLPGHEHGEGLRETLRALGGNRLPEVNKGALWGFGTGFNTFFAAISLGAAVAIVIWSCRAAAAREGLLCVALGLILGGTLGNFYDRVVFDGVRDFLHWIYLFDFPIFNIADSCLVCGAFLLLLQAFYFQPDGDKQPDQPLAAAAPAPTAPAPEHHVAEVPSAN